MEEQDQAPEETSDDTTSDEGEIGGSAETPEPAELPSDAEREAGGGGEEDDSASEGGPDDAGDSGDDSGDDDSGDSEESGD